MVAFARDTFFRHLRLYQHVHAVAQPAQAVLRAVVVEAPLRPPALAEATEEEQEQKWEDDLVEEGFYEDEQEEEKKEEEEEVETKGEEGKEGGADHGDAGEEKE